MKIDDGNFRTDLDDYFENCFYKGERQKQITPFIVIESKIIRGVWTLYEILSLPPKTEILQAWPGKWKTDIFTFTVKDIKDWLRQKEK